MAKKKPGRKSISAASRFMLTLPQRHIDMLRILRREHGWSNAECVRRLMDVGWPVLRGNTVPQQSHEHIAITLIASQIEALQWISKCSRELTTDTTKPSDVTRDTISVLEWHGLANVEHGSDDIGSEYELISITPDGLLWLEMMRSG